ncbi:MAG: PPOX class F420-dependent oxidoreductase [Ilumatobacteraceae bacterium]
MTFKRDGTPVATPIWFNVIDDKIYFTTEAGAWKIKRIRNDPTVRFAVCTQRGKVIGPVFTGTARVLSKDELAPVMAAKKKRYLLARLVMALPGKKDQVAVEITPGPAARLT